MQSVYKCPIAMATLNLVDQGKLMLDQPVRLTVADYVPSEIHSPVRDQFPNGTTVTLKELLRLAVMESDGSASDKLLDLDGGEQVVESYLVRLGVTGIKIRTKERDMAADSRAQYRSWAHPSEAAKLLRKIWKGEGLTRESRALLLDMMTNTSTAPHRIKFLLPEGTIVAHKSGTSGMARGLAAATNDCGIVTLPNGRHLIIAVFVMDSSADEATRDMVIAKVAKLAWDRYR